MTSQFRLSGALRSAAARIHGVIMLLGIGLAGTAAPVAQKPPDNSELDKLVREYVGLDERVASDRTRQLAILTRLDAVPPLTAAQAEAWRKKIVKVWQALAKLPDGPGEHWRQEKPIRSGRYLIGGKTNKPTGLLVALHGGGAGSGDAASAFSVFEGAGRQLGWAVICPEVLEQTERGWTDSGTDEFVLDLIDTARRTWKLDPDRVFLSGHSMGGYGTWTIGARHADRFAGLAASAGAPTPILDPTSHAAIDLVEGVIPCLRNIRLVSYQSDDDPQVPPDSNRLATKKVEAARAKWGGFDYEYWEESSRGHDLPPGGMLALLQKIAAAKRAPYPEHVVWQPSLTWKRQFYWLHWEMAVPAAIVEAKVDRARNAIDVTSDRPASALKGLSVLLDQGVVDLAKEVVVACQGQEVFRGLVPRQLSTLVLTGASGDPSRTFAARVVLVR